MMSRRQFLLSTGLLTTACLLRTEEGLAVGESPVKIIREAAAKAEVTVQKLRGNLSVLTGSGGNITVFTGRDGKLLVDAGITRPNVEKALASLGPAPVKQLINTHWHFDHTDGNQWLHSLGAEITAHENTRAHLATTTRVDGWDFTFPPAPEGALPTRVFDKELELEFNGERLVLKHYSPAHTDSDLSVHFGHADILNVADTWWNGHFPFIDANTGGSIDGMLLATEQNLACVTDKSILIPGHGPVGNRAQMVEFRDMLATVREKVAALKKQGRTVEEVVAAKPTSAYDDKWGGFVIKGATFTRLVYAGV